MLTRSKTAILILILLILGIASLPLAAGATTHNLAAEFSTTSNPGNGWSFYSGTNLLDYYGYWSGTGTNAWQLSGDFLPAWFKTPSGGISGLDLVAGDVATHGNYYNSPFSMVVWTSDISGTVTVSGSVWETRNLGRTMDWALYVNGTYEGGGSIGVTHLRDDPITFATGLLSLDVGQTVVLQLFPHGPQSEDFVGVDLNIEANAVPLPGAVGLLGAGLALLAWGRRRLG